MAIQTAESESGSVDQDIEITQLRDLYVTLSANDLVERPGLACDTPT
jgi:hypothetical protein